MLGVLAGLLSLPARAGRGADVAPGLRIGVIYRHMVAWTASRLLQPIFEEAGIELTLVDLPSARSEIQLRSGEIDGEAARIPEYGRQRPELLRIDPPIYEVSIHAYSLRKNRLNIAGRESLKSLHVAYQAAIVYAALLSAGLPRTSVAQSPESLYRMLAAERVDAIIDASLNARRRRDRFGLVLDESPLLAHHPVHMYLRGDKAAYMPALSAAIQKLTANGQLAMLIRLNEAAAMHLPSEFD